MTRGRCGSLALHRTTLSFATPRRFNPAHKESIMPRVAPITGKSDVPAEHHAVVDAVVNVFGNVRGPFSMLLHSPKLAERVLPLVTFFRDESVVEPKLRSVAILTRSEEHTSELQSRLHLVCRLLLEKKKKKR